MSGPDLVEPAFHFCVGFALRLVVLKRLGAAADDAAQWAPRAALFFQLLRTRVVGLIVLSMFFSEGWGQFDSWADIQRMGLGGWLGIVGGIIGIGERFSLLPPAAACCLLVLVGACSRCCAV